MPNYPQLAQKIAVLGFVLFAINLYIWGVYSTIGWRASPEFVTITHTLDIGHPVGSPSYSPLANPTTFVPFRSIALRVNLFSACMSALAVSLLISLLYNLLTNSPQWVTCWLFRPF